MLNERKVELELMFSMHKVLLFGFMLHQIVLGGVVLLDYDLIASNVQVSWIQDKTQASTCVKNV